MRISGGHGPNLPLQWLPDVSDHARLCQSGKREMVTVMIVTRFVSESPTHTDTHTTCYSTQYSDSESSESPHFLRHRFFALLVPSQPPKSGRARDRNPLQDTTWKGLINTSKPGHNIWTCMNVREHWRSLWLLELKHVHQWVLHETVTRSGHNGLGAAKLWAAAARIAANHIGRNLY